MVCFSLTGICPHQGGSRLFVIPVACLSEDPVGLSFLGVCLPFVDTDSTFWVRVSRSEGESPSCATQLRCFECWSFVLLLLLTNILTRFNRELRRELAWSRINLVPVILAEQDRDIHRRNLANLAREKEIMKDVEGWEVSFTSLAASQAASATLTRLIRFFSLRAGWQEGLQHGPLRTAKHRCHVNTISSQQQVYHKFHFSFMRNVTHMQHSIHYYAVVMHVSIVVGTDMLFSLTCSPPL